MFRFGDPFRRRLNNLQAFHGNNLFRFGRPVGGQNGQEHAVRNSSLTGRLLQ